MSTQFTIHLRLQVKLVNLKSDSHPPKNNFLFALMMALKNDEKCFLSHLQSSFRSQDI